MRYTVLILSLVLFSTPAVWAQPSLSDILQAGQVLRGQRGGSDLDRAVRIGTVLYQIHRTRRGNANRAPINLPRQAPRFPQSPRPRQPQPRTLPAPRPQRPPVVVERGKPSGYDYIAVSGKPMRLDPQKLPLTVNPGTPEHTQTVQKAVDLWNRAGMGTLFALTQGPADITVDWSGRAVSPGARAETRMKTSSRVVVPTGISVKEGGRSRYHLARVMTHELGHVLGLDHSTSREDIMYRSEGGGDLVLSDRDVKMLRWLYSQDSYVPVVGATKQGGSSPVYSFQPMTFQCGCGHRH